MAPFHRFRRLAPSSKWQCLKKTFELEKTKKQAQLDLGPPLCTLLQITDIPPLRSYEMKVLRTMTHVPGVLDEPYSQLNPLSGEVVQARQST